MDWTDNKKQAADVDRSVWLNKLLDDHPTASKAASAGLGLSSVMDVLGFAEGMMPNAWSRIRNENPMTFRGASWAPYAGLAAAGAPLPLYSPLMMSTLARDPAVKREMSDAWSHQQRIGQPNKLSGHTSELARILAEE